MRWIGLTESCGSGDWVDYENMFVLMCTSSNIYCAQSFPLDVRENAERFAVLSGGLSRGASHWKYPADLYHPHSPETSLVMKLPDT